MTAPRTFAMPCVPPSLNDWSRSHWRRRHQLTHTWAAIVAAAAAHARVPMYLEPVVIAVRYSFRTAKSRDLDNYTPKFVLDGLKRRVIPDDTSAYVTRLVLEIRTGTGADETRITIQPASACGACGCRGTT